jgi:SpoVK/Ycf46/Vps4 family AAA+-type ATPase
MSQSTSVHDLKTLVLSSHPVIVIETVEEERVRSLLQSVATQVRLPLLEWSITKGLTKAEGSYAYSKTTTQPGALLQHLYDLPISGIFFLKDLSRHLDDPATARQFRDMTQEFIKTRSTAVVTGTPVHLPYEIEQAAIRYQLRLPDRTELDQVVQCVLQSVSKTHKVAVSLSTEQQEDILRALRGMTLNQARQAVSRVVLEDGRLTADDLREILDRKAQLIREGGLLEYYPVADNRFQLGGFAKLKAWLDRARVGFSAEAKTLNLTPPRGILLVGVPGCGKSLAAKVIAREWALPLLKLDAGRLFDKFIGESEKNFRKAIDMAESMAPVAFWVDEIEKAMVSGGGSEADGGLSRRLFGAFLTWLQEKKEEVFVVATANDLSSLPPELLRKGRFDEIFFVDLPNEPERQAIWTIHLTLRKQDPSTFDLVKIVSASEGFSGAEIEQAVVAALYRALHQKQPLTTDLLVDELTQTVPLSVTRREDIEALRHTAQGRFVSVR